MKLALVFSTLCLFVLLTSSTFDYFSPELKIDYFFPRSGDLLIFAETQAKAFRARVVSSNPKYALKENSLDDVAVADYFAHINGLGVFNEKTDRRSFPSIQYFEKPSAQLIFVLDDIEEGSKLGAVSAGVASEVSTATSRLSTPLSFLTTLFSGVHSAEHGIISAKWWDNIFGTYVTAYSQDETTKVSGEAYKANLGSFYSWTSKGQSLVATYASDYSIGATLAPHSKLFSNEQFDVSNLYSAYYDHDRQAIGNVFEKEGSRGWTRERNIVGVERLQAIFGNKYTFSQDKNTNEIIVQFKDSAVSFDVSNPSDEEFLAQFNVISVLLNTIQTKESLLLNDNVPDLYSFYLSGLMSCRGQEEKMMIVRELLNDFTLYVQSKVESFYNSQTNVASHFVLVEAHGDCQMTTQKKAELARLLRAELGSQLSNEDDIEHTLPHVYLLPSLSLFQVNQIYFSLESLLRNTEYKIHSPIDPLLSSFKARQDSNSTSSSDDSDTVVFQTVLWSSIAIAVAVMVAVYFIVCMDTGQDTIIYRPVPHIHKA